MYKVKEGVFVLFLEHMCILFQLIYKKSIELKKK
jgi:hypothetical protein